MRVPGIAWWAGGAGPRGVVRQPASQLDLLPSLAALAGVATPPGIALDGQSLALTLTAGHTVSRENSNMYTALHLQPTTKPVFLYRGSRLYAVRWAEYKAHYWTWTTPQVNIVLITGGFACPVSPDCVLVVANPSLVCRLPSPFSVFQSLRAPTCFRLYRVGNSPNFLRRGLSCCVFI